MIILESNPTDGQRATSPKAVFIAQFGIGEDAKASCTDIMLEGEKLAGQAPSNGRLEVEDMVCPSSATY